MNYTTSELALNLPNVPFLMDLTQLYQQFCQLSDQRCRRGVRYPLAKVLLLALLGKLAGHNKFEQIADWTAAHRVELGQWLDLIRPTAPHACTFSRVLGEGLICEQLEQLVSQHFQAQLASQIPQRGSLTLSIDGKTLRGTIKTGNTQGVHLMAAYLPKQGVVLAQVAVGTKTNEITAAPRLLSSLDLRGIVVSGDAMQAQKGLSVQIVAAGGDYLWLVKANQKGLLGEISQLFEPLEWGAGFGPVALEFASFVEYSTGHGRVEKRTITVSSELAGYSYWPHLAQVFKLEREWLELATDQVKSEVRYGITSLPSLVAK